MRSKAVFRAHLSAAMTLSIDSIENGAIHISWNKNQHDVAGFILERKTNGSFTKIADLGADSNYYSDSLIEPSSDYVYRVSAYTENDTSRWSNQLLVTSSNQNGLPSPAYLPFPENNATNIDQLQVLKWKKGLLADYHKLYFGTTDPPPFVADIYTISFTPDSLLLDGVYFWRIDEVNEMGITTGETWRFDMEKVETATFPESESSLSIYPNPASEMVFIESPETGSTVSVYYLNGRLLYNNAIHADKFEIDMSKWHNGVYIVKIIGAEQISYAKLIKE